jgi:hypothetical protein
MIFSINTGVQQCDERLILTENADGKGEGVMFGSQLIGVARTEASAACGTCPMSFSKAIA